MYVCTFRRSGVAAESAASGARMRGRATRERTARSGDASLLAAATTAKVALTNNNNTGVGRGLGNLNFISVIDTQ